MLQEPNKKELYDLFVKLEFVKLIDRYKLREAAPEPEPQQVAVQLPHRQELPEAGTPAPWSWGRTAPWPWLGQKGYAPCRPWSGRAAWRPFGAGDPKICHDLKTCLHDLEALGLPQAGFRFDTALAAYDLNPSQGGLQPDQGGHGLPGPDAGGPGGPGCRPVAAEGSAWSRSCRSRGWRTCIGKSRLPLCATLYRMEREGVAVDRNTLVSFGQMLTERIAACEQAIFGYAGGEFNINSTKQLGEVLFERLNLPPVKKTKTGYSTNAEVLEKLADKHPMVRQVMEYRVLTKLKSTYADGLLKVIGPDGRIRTTFQNLVTATGRLSSTDPNLQNIPVRTELGSEIRKMFVPRPGWVFVDADYSQIELRVLAHIAEDPLMQEAFRTGRDIHTATAAQVFGVPRRRSRPSSAAMPRR